MLVPDWLWQGVSGNIIAAILIFCGAAVLAILRKFYQRESSTVLYAMAGAFWVFGMLMMFRIWSVTTPPVDQTSAHSLVRAWIDKYHMTSKVIEDSGAIFTMQAVLNNTSMIVSQPRDTPTFIVLEATIREIPPISDPEVIRQIKLNLLRLPVGFFRLNAPLDHFTIQRHIPINSSLTESSFIDGMEEIERAVNTVNNSISDLAMPKH
jgi:hypothetical protein